MKISKPQYQQLTNERHVYKRLLKKQSLEEDELLIREELEELNERISNRLRDDNKE